MGGPKLIRRRQLQTQLRDSLWKFWPSVACLMLFEMVYFRGIELIFTGGHISLAVAFKQLNVILGLHKRNYSLTRVKELYIGPFKATARLMWPTVKKSLTPLVYFMKNKD